MWVSPPDSTKASTRGKLAAIEPCPVLRAHVDDDAARAAEVPAVHERAAHRARDVAHRRRGGARARSRADDARVERVALEQVAKRRDLDELTAAPPAVVHRARAAIEHGHGDVAVRARERAVARDGLEPQVAAAPGAVHGVWRAHVKARRAADRRDGSVAVGAPARALGHAGAARGADERDGVGHALEYSRPRRTGRSGRAVEGSGFENRRTGNGTRGSNPFSSAATTRWSASRECRDRRRSRCRWAPTRSMSRSWAFMCAADADGQRRCPGVLHVPRRLPHGREALLVGGALPVLEALLGERPVEGVLDARDVLRRQIGH